MVARFAARVEEQVIFECVSATKPVVDVDPCPRDVKANVASVGCLCRFGLEPARRLLLVDPKMVNEIRFDQRVPWEVAAGPVGAGPGRLPSGRAARVPGTSRRRRAKARHDVISDPHT